MPVLQDSLIWPQVGRDAAAMEEALGTAWAQVLQSLGESWALVLMIISCDRLLLTF